MLCNAKEFLIANFIQCVLGLVIAAAAKHWTRTEVTLHLSSVRLHSSWHEFLEDFQRLIFVSRGVSLHPGRSSLTTTYYMSIVDILFSSNHNIHKSSCGLCFWASDPLIERFSKIHQLKSLKPKNNE